MASKPEKPVPLGCRRKEPRQRVRLAAFVRAPHSVGWYALQDLSVGGASLVKGAVLPAGTGIELTIHSDVLSPIRLRGRVVYGEDAHMGVQFLHEASDTEDAIQTLLLSELERSYRASAG